MSDRASKGSEDDDARFYISLVDVILGICAEQRAESESDQTA